jgi:hypothetical protein
MRYGAEDKRDRKNLENFYYATLCDILQSPMSHEEKATHPRHIEAKITLLHHHERRKVLLANAEGEYMECKEPSLYHYIKAKRRNDACMVHHVLDADGQLKATPQSILKAFTCYFWKKYEAIPVESTPLQNVLDMIPANFPPEAQNAMDAPITLEEM